MSLAMLAFRATSDEGVCWMRRHARKKKEERTLGGMIIQSTKYNLQSLIIFIYILSHICLAAKLHKHDSQSLQ